MQWQGHRDMLHDVERNEAYTRAIRMAVRRLRRRHQQVTAIDIGTGSSLLGCLAAQEGASVTAFETIPALARLAKGVVSDNALPVEIIAGHSTDSAAAIRAELMTHELLDSGLHGEGLLPAVRHAWRELLVEDALSVPASVTLVVQACRSPYLRRAAHLEEAATSVLGSPSSVDECAGHAQFLELRAEALIAAGALVPLSAPVRVLTMDLGAAPPEGVQAPPPQPLRPLEEGSGVAPDAILSWWECVMLSDPMTEAEAEAEASEEELPTLSTNPWPAAARTVECRAGRDAEHRAGRHACSDGRHDGDYAVADEIPETEGDPAERPEMLEREHWMTVAYLLPPGSPPLSEHTAVQAAYDDYEVWMRLVKQPRCKRPEQHVGMLPPPSRPLCTCGVHALWGHERLQELNSTIDYTAAAAAAAAFLRRLSSELPSGAGSRLLDLGDGPLWSVLVGRSGGFATCAEVSVAMRTLSARFVAAAGCSRVVEVMLLERLAEEEDEGEGEEEEESKGEGDDDEGGDEDAGKDEAEAEGEGAGVEDGGGECASAAPPPSPPRSSADWATTEALRTALGIGAAGWRFDALLIEPSFTAFKRCWAGEQLAEALRRRWWAEAHGLVARCAPMLPSSAKLRACLVECHDLWRRHGPVADVADVDVRRFNSLCRPFHSVGRSLPLWQYTHRVLGPGRTWAEVGLPIEGEQGVLGGTIPATLSPGLGPLRGTVHAICAWVDYDYGEGAGVALVQTGPMPEDTNEATSSLLPRFGPTPWWQGIVFLQTPIELSADAESQHLSRLEAAISLDLRRGELSAVVRQRGPCDEV